MDTDRIRETIIGFLRQVDGVPEHPSTEATFDELGVDSMSTMDLLLLVEKEFGIEIPDDRLPTITTVDRMVDFVASADQEARK
ncbi:MULTISPECIES: acyl carrier protein [Actinokineospora]|uniref:Acyl carrier protein n=1 Tax=Actinokineospora fastidiosa TaxID=1816 RepID=A0A918LHV5_9PSEU|nr:MULTISPECIES: acyl carrier protein [Actinokineospora]UVS78113.1 Acyl carrier protein [Actinokineospora sp. UTMC 2448]GGS49603.1 acyl carrier protein [Actinokineospora fastidiosa]